LKDRTYCYLPPSQESYKGIARSSALAPLRPRRRCVIDSTDCVEEVVDRILASPEDNPAIIDPLPPAGCGHFINPRQDAGGNTGARPRK